jgi:hypothetical protein
MVCKPVFEPDDEYDQACAGDGVSRYGAYLARYVAWFTEDGVPTTDAVRFAAAAWRIAQPPVMAPGYVLASRVVLDSHLRWDENRGAVVCVDIEVSSEADAADPHGRAAGDRARLTVVRVVVPLLDARLPEACYWHGWPDITSAKRAVHRVCAAINATAGSVVTVDPRTGSPR